MRASTLPLILLLACTAGCGVYRTITVKSDPPGAMVYMNGLEIGRTPFTRDFVWYGTYDVEVRKDGYHTLKVKSDVNPPWWQVIPFDFFAELVPGHPHDHRRLYYSLTPMSDEAADPELMIRRAARLAEQLESSDRTRNPAATRSTSKPSHPATTRFTTRPSTTRASSGPSTGPTTRPTTTTQSSH